MHSIALWPTVAAVSIATLWDIRCCRIPNWLVIPFGSSGLIVSGVIGHWHGLQQSLQGILLGALLMGVLYWLGGMGMGDVKLCAAIGAWIGPSQLGLALVAMAIAGGIMAFLWAACGGFLLESLDGVGDLVFGIRKRGFRPHETLVLTNQNTRKLPYAPAIAIGVMFSFLAVK